MEEYLYDPERWEKMFPLDEYRTIHGYEPYGQIVTSPCHLAINEQLRAKRKENLYGYLGIPTDVFVFGKGEPLRREVTKVGGLPYRSVDVDWPMAPDGNPMTFLAQFNFSESRDILGPLPGDILLVFIREELPLSNDKHAIAFEWQNLNIAVDDLIQADKVPTPAWTFFTGYGVRHRTIDYPNTRDAFMDINSGHLLTTLQGTKIGGARPSFEESCEAKGHFLCSLGSICCAFDTPYPWVNHPSSLSHKEILVPQNQLAWGDAGSLLFSIDGYGAMHWEMTSY